LIEAYYENGKLYPWRTRRDLGEVIPGLLKRFPRNDLFARATLEEIVGAEELHQAKHWQAEEFESGVFLSQADGTYLFEPLPRLAQIAPLQGIAATDFDGDGFLDIIAVQNSFAPDPSVGRFDGGLGIFLRGDGHGHFEAVPAEKSGVIVPRDAKALAVADLNNDGWPDFITSRNNDSPLVFLNRGATARTPHRVHLQDSDGKHTTIGSSVTATYKDGKFVTREIVTASSYFSQSSPDLFFADDAENPLVGIGVCWADGVTEMFSVSRESTVFTCLRGGGRKQ
jgi:hypothetical protein